jgi:hypothetical protein
MPDRTIGIPSFEVIFHEHNSRSLLEDEGLGCETSLFESISESCSPMRLHFKNKRIIMDCIETIGIVGIDREIFRKKLRMILGLDRQMSRLQEIK